MERSGASPARMTALLDNALLERVQRLRINALRRFTNRSHGEHQSGKGGRSTEFADYRDYVEGDDIRFVDWNIFARLNRPYLKLYHVEEEMHVVVLVDASSSMLFEAKLDRARQIAAAFGAMGLFGVERVSIFAFNQRETGTPHYLPPTGGRGSLGKLLGFVESITGGGDAPFEDGVAALLRRHRGRGVAVVLSDFLTYGDLQRPFNYLFSAGLEIFAVQILGPTEIDPELAGDLRILDCETRNMLDITAASDVLALYQEYRLAYQARLEMLCRQRSGRALSISSADPIEWVLLDLLRRRGWVT